MYSDKLTEIPNRFALLKYLKEIEHANVFLMNVDNFNNINSTYDFEIGDKVLIEITRFIKLIKPDICKLFRMNSDEFVLVSERSMSTEELASVAKSIISFFDNTEITVDDDIEIKISFSIGIATGSGAKVLNHAKSTIEELREHERGSYKIYDPESLFNKKHKENIYWVKKIKRAFEDDRIVAFYQPIVDNQTKKIQKYECLVRIMEEGLLIPPIRFMEASKLTGTLTLLTKAVIKQSFAKFSGREYQFSINITNSDLHIEYLEEYLLFYAKKYEIEPSRVVLEILEDINTLNKPKILTQLNSLRSHGFKISIDDFGSESSNFSRLLEFSPDYLKIDGSFIKNILDDKKSLIIVEAIVFICKNSNIKTIAEFVHSKEVQDKIEELGIDYSQGYYFGEPKAELVDE